jgi:hypothetical protein
MISYRANLFESLNKQLNLGLQDGDFIEFRGRTYVVMQNYIWQQGKELFLECMDDTGKNIAIKKEDLEKEKYKKINPPIKPAHKVGDMIDGWKIISILYSIGSKKFQYAAINDELKEAVEFYDFEDLKRKKRSNYSSHYYTTYKEWTSR